MKPIRTCQLCEATSAGTAVHFTQQRRICDWCYDELARKGLRHCTLCGGSYPTARAVKHYPNYCPACRKARRSAKYHANREREHERRRAWHAAHPGAHAAKQRAYYERDPEAHRAYHRAYRERNREQLRVRRKERYEQRRAYYLDVQRRWRAKARAHRAAYDRLWKTRRKLAILRGER